MLVVAQELERRKLLCCWWRGLQQTLVVAQELERWKLLVCRLEKNRQIFSKSGEILLMFCRRLRTKTVAATLTSAAVSRHSAKDGGHLRRPPWATDTMGAAAPKEESDQLPQSCRRHSVHKKN
jgi:hypothetical protein